MKRASPLCKVMSLFETIIAITFTDAFMTSINILCPLRYSLRYGGICVSKGDHFEMIKIILK